MLIKTILAYTIIFGLIAILIGGLTWLIEGADQSYGGV